PGSSGLDLNQVLSFRSSRVHALTVDSDVHIERSLDIDQPTSSLFKSLMFPPLNLTMDLSDPLSEVTTGLFLFFCPDPRSGILIVAYPCPFCPLCSSLARPLKLIFIEANEPQQQSLIDHSSFDLQTNGSNLDRIRKSGGSTPVTHRYLAMIGFEGKAGKFFYYCPAWITSVGAECDHTIHHSTRTNSEKSVDIDETKTLPEGLDMLADSLADKHEKQLIDHKTGQPPKFDLILISIGEEGQLGSLYPPHPILGESIWIVAWSGDVWEPPSNRIALTPPVLNSARQFAFLAVGSEIVEIVPDGLERSIQSDVHGRR
ncbi:hypothetical protein MJO28_016940, partial [Puccinia striiformis f. sp. tritici]